LVSLDDGDSFKGRVGITIDQKLSQTMEDGSTSLSHVYGITNLHYDILGESRVMVSGTSFVSQADRLTGEIGIGGSYNWLNNKYSLYGEALAATGLENFGDSYQLKGTAGFKVKF